MKNGNLKKNAKIDYVIILFHNGTIALKLKAHSYLVTKFVYFTDQLYIIHMC